MSQASRILAALIVGLVAGIGITRLGVTIVGATIAIAQPVGTAWLNGLQMTVVPLVVALLVLGIAAGADAARAGRVAGRAMMLFVAVLWLSSLLAAGLTPFLLRAWPLASPAAAALRGALAGVKPVGTVPPFGDFIAAVVPGNVVAAAANDAFLPLIVFSLIFGFAVTRLADEPRRLLVGFFQAIADAMLIVINWVLWLAPLGVFALAFVVGARAGTAAFGALLHYVVIVSGVGIVVWLASFPLGAIGGRMTLGRFARATAAAQAVAISTQSSLASLPAMLRGAEAAGIEASNSAIVLPLAVAIFRATGPAMNLAVGIYIALWYGVPLTATTLGAGIAVAAITTMGAVSLPGAVSYISSIAPICLAMGVPIAPLGLLIAVETFPDIFRTLGNVTMDLAAAATISARSGAPRRRGAGR